MQRKQVGLSIVLMSRSTVIETVVEVKVAVPRIYDKYR